MKCLKSNSQDLRDLFGRSILVRHIAEHLVSFDAGADASAIRSFMDERDFDIVGVRQHGLINGYAQKAGLRDGILADSIIRFSEHQILDDTATLIEAFGLLRNETHVFVHVFGQIGGIVTRGDLQKAPVRMWLFGLLNLIEMQLVRIIRELYHDGAWRDRLTEARLKKAEGLLEERKRRNEATDLIDCLQLCDKGRIVLGKNGFGVDLGFPSVSQVDEYLKNMEQLRNTLAHAQDLIIGLEWNDIFVLAERAEDLLQGFEKICAE